MIDPSYLSWRFAPFSHLAVCALATVIYSAMRGERTLEGGMIWIAAIVLLAVGAFVLTQGGQKLGSILASAGAIIVLVKLIT